MTKKGKKWRVAGISFEHFHMGDLLRMVSQHPRAEIAGICDDQPDRMRQAIADGAIPPERVFSDVDACMGKCRPDVVILCSATASHADYVENWLRTEPICWSRNRLRRRWQRRTG
jgi:glucose-fructose oxidoreductase